MTTVRPTHALARRAFAPLLVATILLAAGAARAHEGHQHAEEPAPLVRSSDFAGTARSATSELHELVVRAAAAAPGAPARVHLLLADATTNAPIEGATLELVPAGADSGWNAIAIAPGVYEAHVPDPSRGLDVLVRRGDTLDLLTIDSLATAEAPPVGGAGPLRAGLRVPGLPGWPWIVAALVAIGAAIGLLRRRAVRRAGMLLIIAGLGFGALTSSDARGQAPAGARFIAKESQFEIGLRTEIVQAETLAPTRSAFGTVVADPGASASVIAPQTGRFVAARTWRPGDRVHRGRQIGAVLVVDELPVRAPLGGTIATIDVVPGQTVAAGQTLATIVDLSRVRIDLPLYGDALAAGLGARTARVRLAALPERDFAARVEGLAAAGTNSGPGAPLVLSAANADGLLRPGMVVEVTLELPGAVSALTVPAAAIVHTEQGPALFVKIAPEGFALRAVTLGARAGRRVAIARGVTAGEKIVISGLAPLLATAEAPR